MSFFLGLGLFVFITIYSFIIIESTDTDVYKTLAGNIVMITGNITLTILYTLGTIFESESKISYISGIVVAIIMSLSIKIFYLNYKQTNK